MDPELLVELIGELNDQEREFLGRIATMFLDEKWFRRPSEKLEDPEREERVREFMARFNESRRV